MTLAKLDVRVIDGLPHYDSWISIANYNMAHAGGLVSFDGYAAEGDCPPIDVKAISEPLVTPKFWEKQSADGRWWSYNMKTAYVSQFGAAKNNASINEAAFIQAAFDFGENKQLIMDGICYVTGGENLTISNTMTVTWPTHRGFYNRIVFKGTGTKAIRTAQTHPDDGTDAPISGGIILAASGIILENPFVDLYCDYSNTAPSNLGDNYDDGILVKAVNHCHIINPRTRGYWRKSGIHVDNTGANSNIDGLRIIGGELQGKYSLSMLGARPKTGNSGILIDDNRGAGGMSDVRVQQTSFRGYYHHSGRRISDTDGGCLEIESYVYPGTSVVDSVQGQVYEQVRFMAADPKIMDIRKARRITFDKCFVDRPGGFVKTDGVTGVADADCLIRFEAGAKQIRFRDTDVYRSTFSIASGAIVEMSGGVDVNGNPVELSWTPALSAVTASYSSRTGRYTRVGNRVNFWAQMAISSLDTADNSTFTLAGLPYAIKANTALSLEIDYRLSTIGNFGATDVIVGVPAPSLTTGISLYTPAKATVTYNGGKFNASGNLYVSGWYLAEGETP